MSNEKKYKDKISTKIVDSLETKKRLFADGRTKDEFENRSHLRFKF